MSALTRKAYGMLAVARGLWRNPRALGLAFKRKERAELAFWMIKEMREGSLATQTEGYRFIFTEAFGLDEGFFAGKRVLDVGCGPRGSLEWATMASERVGLDPLVSSYRRLGADRHEMRYVEGEIEDPPLPPAHFDIAASINSLDHVDDVERAIEGLHAVLRPGGTLLVLTELNHAPRATEPQDFSWEVVERFAERFEVVDRLDLEVPPEGPMDSVSAGLEFDHSNPGPRSGALRLILRKPERQR